MKLLSVLLSVSGLIWVSPVLSEMLRAEGAGTQRQKETSSSPIVSESPNHPSVINLQQNNRGTAADLLAQNNLTQVTELEVNPTAAGLELILKTTADGARLVPLVLPEGNDLVIDILDTVLASSISNGVTKTNPAPGITVISLAQINESSIRLTITGENQAPSAEVVPSEQNLVLSISPEATAAQQNDSTQTIDVIVTEVGTRTETDPQDVPQSIQVIPQEIIQKREVNELTEALENIPGVISSFDNLLFNDVVIRGFDGDYRRNGLLNIFIEDASIQTANIERLEVLKGPASVLYGSGSFGGTVNVVTEQPTAEPYYKIDADIGNFDLYGGSGDLSGPLNESKSLKYRLNFAAETNDTFIDGVSRERYLVNPVLSWEIGKNTDITFEAEYSNLTADNNFGIPALGTVLDNINGELDQELNFGDPDIEIREIDTILVGYDLEHRFSDDWRIRNAFQYQHRSAPEFSIFENALQDDQRTLERAFVDVPEFDITGFLLDTSVVGNFNTGSRIKHELLAGIELFRSEELSNIGVGEVSTIDLFAPELSNTVIGPVTEFFISETTNETLGIYLQDRIEFFDKVILLAGIRFDIVTSRFEDEVFDTVDFDQNEEFSPRVGIVYQPIEELSLYGNFTQSFTPNFFGFSSTGEPFEPQTGTQFEVGVKADINNKISVTLAYFDITLDNIPTTDPDDVFFEIIAGEQNSEGVELFVAGEILPGWDVIGGYTYTDATITESNDFEVGNRVNNIPENTVSFLTSYEIQKGSLKGLGGSLGIYFVGDREGDLDNSFEIPSYTRTDMSIFYNRDKFKTALNFRNLFDIDYFENAETDLRVRFGAPFTVVGSLSYEF